MLVVNETFIPIKGYEGLYEISSEGRVKSCRKKDFFLKQHDDTHGYLFVNLSKNGKGTSIKVHRLVAEHFLDNPCNLRDVNHGTRNLRANTTKSKEVYQLTKEDVLVAKFKNGYEAQEVTQIKESSISACCNGKRKTAGGFKWSFTYVGSEEE